MFRSPPQGCAILALGKSAGHCDIFSLFWRGHPGPFGPGARFLSLSTSAHGTGSFCVVREQSCLVWYRRKFSSILGLHALDACCNKQKRLQTSALPWQGWGVASPPGENCCPRTFSNLRMHWTVLEGWLRDRLRVVTPEVLILGSGEVPRSRPSNRFPGAAASAVPGSPTLGTTS